MPFCRTLATAAALLVLLSGGAMAQDRSQQPTQIQIQYHDLVPAGGDSAPVFLKIFDQMRKDCELVGKAFSRKCSISQINIYTNPNTSGDMAGTKMVNATATMTLPPETAGGTAASSPSK